MTKALFPSRDRRERLSGISRILRPLACGALAILLGAAAMAMQTPSPKPGAASKPKTAVKKPAARSKAKAKTKKARAPQRQIRPTPERYKQIEQALALRGYLKEEPSGKWSPGAVEALKGFQAANQLAPTGRIDARSLMELGLAQKHDRVANPVR